MAEATTIELPAIPEIEQGPPLPWQPPSEKDLPYDDGVPMESDRHRDQMNLLIGTLRDYDTERRLFTGGNMFVYYRATEEGRNESVGPDVFVVLDAEQRARKSWVVWNEGRRPDVVIELLSDSTAAYDRTAKKQLYQTILGVPEYFYYDPFSGEWAGFLLIGRMYQPIEPDAQGRLVSQTLQLALMRWHGTYSGNEATWLRWCTLDGVLLPTGMEVAEQERERAEQERARAEQERTRADELAALLARYQAQFGALDEPSS